MKITHQPLLPLLFMLLCTLSSCTMTTMANWFDTKRVDTDYIYEHAIELTTAIPHEVTLPDTLADKKGKRTKKTIPAGTKLKVLAIGHDRKFDVSHEKWFKTNTEFVVELADNSRYLCPLPEIFIGRRVASKADKKDSITIERIGQKSKGKANMLILYGKDSQNRIKEYTYSDIDYDTKPILPMTETFSGRYLSYKYLKDKLEGKSFQEVEQILKPAQRVIRKGNDRIASYLHIGTTSPHESTFYRNTTIYFADNKVAGIYGQNFDNFMLSNLPGFLSISKWQSLMLTAGNDYYVFPRFSFFNFYQLGGWQAREFISGFLLILFFGILAFLPSLINRWTFFYIKPIPNTIIKWIGWFMTASTLYIATISLCYDESLLIVIIQTAFLGGFMIGSFIFVTAGVEGGRCPRCHSVRSLIDHGNSGQNTTTYQSDALKRNDSDSKKFRIRHTLTSWKENYTCKKCGYQFYYKKSSRDTYEVDA